MIFSQEDYPIDKSILFPFSRIPVQLGGGQPLRRIVKVKEENKDSRICIFCLFGNWIALHIFCSLGPRSKRLQIIRVRWSKRDASFTVDVLSPVHSICHPWQIAADYKRIIKTLYVAVETLTKYMQGYPISIQVTNVQILLSLSSSLTFLVLQAVALIYELNVLEIFSAVF